MLKKLIGLTLAVASLAGCATTPAGGDDLSDLFGPTMSGAQLEKALAEADKYPLGSKENPVRASMPQGQHDYLSRLRCANGAAPAFERSGSVGLGPYGKIMDVYSVECPNSTPASSGIYMDMYHNHVENRPVPGFTIKS